MMRNYSRPRRLRRGLALQVLLVVGACAGSVAPSLRAQTEGAAAAVVDGKIITMKDVDASVSAQILPLQQQLYAIRKRALENLILRAILEGEAAKRKISVEELRKQLTIADTRVTSGEVERVYQENALVFAAMSPDEAKERLRLDLESQSRMRSYRGAVERLRRNAAVEIRLAEPGPGAAGGENEAATRGPKEAAISLTEFSDFHCPFCKSFQDTLSQAVRKHEKTVRHVFRNLPSESHPGSLRMRTARAAFCAGEQDLFWQYYDALFAAEEITPGQLDLIAARVGLAMPRFKDCLDSEASRAAVLRDIQEAKRLGVDGTPTLVINGKIVRGAISIERLESLLEQELAAATKNAPHRQR